MQYEPAGGSTMFRPPGAEHVRTAVKSVTGGSTTHRSVPDDQHGLAWAGPPQGAALVSGPGIGEGKRRGDADLQHVGVAHAGDPGQAVSLGRDDEEERGDAVLVGKLLRGRLLQGDQAPAATERREQGFRYLPADERLLVGVDRVPRERTYSTSGAWTVPVTLAPSTVASWVTKAPTPPAPLCTSTRWPG